MLLVKFVAFFITNSNTILTDALESIVNVLAASFTLYGLMLSAKPRDTDHPYGHGKVEYLSSGVEGILIVVAGLAMTGKAIYNFFYPVELQALDIGIILTLITGIINYIIGVVVQKFGERSRSYALLAGGKHLKTDAYSTAAMIVGLVIIFFTGAVWIDNVIAIVFGGMIAFAGIKILRRSVAGMMDEADYELIREVLGVLNKNRRENWIDVHKLRVIKYGDILHIDCHVTLPWYLTLKEAHHELEELDRLVNKNHEQEVEFFIHADPCLPASCAICQKKDCAHRQSQSRQKIEWTLENTVINEKHSIETSKD